MDNTSSTFEKEISRGFDGSNKNEATIRGLIDVKEELNSYLDGYLFSSQAVERTTYEQVEEEDPISGKIKTIRKPKKVIMYRHLPTEEKIASCRGLGFDCHERNFMPDSTKAYSKCINPDIFEGFCVSYNEDSDGKYLTRLERLKKHIMDFHKKEVDIDDIIYNSKDKWLTWDPIFNEQGYLAVKNYIMLNLSSLSSTTITPDKKNRFGMDTEEIISNEASDAALRNIQEICVCHREYTLSGANLSPTKQNELQDLEYSLFKAAAKRSLNGIFLRGIISSIEERRVDIHQDNAGSNNKEANSIFGKVLNRGGQGN